MSDINTLTKRQEQVLKAIYRYLQDSGYPPTLADLRDELGVSSNQAVLDFLKVLETKEYIKREEGTARGLKILQKGYEVLGEKLMIPFVGVSAAGPYTQAHEINEWHVVKDTQVTPDDKLVKINGDSMIEAGLNDGDIVIIREVKEFKNGDIVLARFDGETTVKRLVNRDGRVYLKPENPDYKNIPFYPDTRLLGKVVGILGKSKING